MNPPNNSPAAKSSITSTLNERGASSWDLVLKILSITLVSLFAFSSGVWFGKKLSDSDYQRQALEGEFDKEVRKTASTEEHDSHAAKEEGLTDEEVVAAAEKALETQKTTAATKSEEPKHEVAAKHEEPKHEVAAKHEEPKHEVAAKHEESHATPKAPARAVASAPAHGATKPDLSAAHQAAERVANNAAPVAAEKPAPEKRVPSSLPKTVGSMNDVEFTVQVASYPSQEAAKEHVETLVKKGFPAFPVEAKINGKTYYRVSVGSFKSFSDASKFRVQLLKQADLSAALVQRIAR